MTYFIHGGILMHKLPKTIFEPIYRIARPRSVQIEEMDLPSIAPPKDYWEYKFLTIEDGDAIYTCDTRIKNLILFNDTYHSGNPINPNVDIRGRAFKILMGYQQGFRNLWNEWRGKDDEYKNRGMEEMFKVISSEIENAVKA